MFFNRQDAGRRLAGRLLEQRLEQPVVLGLPRGGVVVAAEIAAALEAPLDVLVVRKLPAPEQPELAVGAVTDGEHPRSVLNQRIIQSLGVGRAYLDRVIAGQLHEVRRRQKLFRGGRAPVEPAGRTVIVVDDGVATGATLLAAVEALRQAGPRRLIVAVPVGPPPSIDTLRDLADEVVCLEMPEDFGAVGTFYEHFEQTSDAEVMMLLEEAARRMAGTTASGR